jgi:RNase adapter protein RapZ
LNQKLQKLVIVTGLSGAGRSVAIRSLEDLGFYCIDRIPTGLLEATTQHLAGKHYGDFAMGLDFKDEQDVKEFNQKLPELKQLFEVDLVFLSATDDVLLNRYNSTRRKHPLSSRVGDLLSAIQLERKLLQGVEALADVYFDTTEMSPHFLSSQIEDRSAKGDKKRQLFVTLTSFGFKYGPGQHFDMILDVRFLKNPYFDPVLKDKTGLDKQVGEYILTDERYGTFKEKSLDLIQFLLMEYYREGKNYFRIGIGCTGGKHRSVFFSEDMAKSLHELSLPNIFVSVKHRDIGF